MPSLKSFFVSLAILSGIGLCGAVAFAWSGLYNVSASSGHWLITRKFLEFGMTNSVRTQSAFIDPPRFDADMVRLGAGHYQGGCLPCHGAPGHDPNPIVGKMLPAPPELVSHLGRWEANELFWIVKHGIKYAGMPSWTTQHRDDEVWSVVAFIRKLPELSPQQYQDLAFGNVTDRTRPPEMIVSSGAAIAALAACARCHGDDTRLPTSTLVPALAGQKKAYLEQALVSYANGTRPSGIMHPIASELRRDEIERLADYYAGLNRKPTATAKQVTADVERGRTIASNGIRSKTVPACLSCHSEAGAPNFPLLTGLSARFLEGQLRLWRSGVRGGSSASALMTRIAERLSDDDIAAVSAYFATTPRPADAGDTPSQPPQPPPASPQPSSQP